ncbi:dimethylarginine dimethylaminohydrolase family protein [Fictibacillus sp. KIGAM418]|uniref:Dimethylarginine dimethylaminohydrolase family protein n=1 Tax=Fictibacillus marinisediminis TaxID=2878389 RepID=A0A9X2BE87_9BACL|nr:dimethylarginine dimethylaminohydrolase family protein [Fictibacillus marinisediminis]MCK6258401.1 dimethylarginine dimethylaminohydrolase family protein [Fictibacillus marinisediminis]
MACYSEYEALKDVILCQPKFMKIREVINETQKYYADENIDTEVAMQQHKQFSKALEDRGIKVHQLPPLEKYPEQVFTRDIGFTIGHTLYISEMGREIRQGEEKVLKEWMNEEHITIKDLKNDSIEGGDVLLDRKTVFVGVSHRTSRAAIESLMQHESDYNVIPVPFNEKYLHLDCVFNILSPEEAIIYPPAFHEEELKLLTSRYKTIEINKEEQFTLGTNILSIGNKTVLALPVNKEINAKLRENGYEVIEVDISEIIKSGGAFRCCTLPLDRKRGCPRSL